MNIEYEIRIDKKYIYIFFFFELGFFLFFFFRSYSSFYFLKKEGLQNKGFFRSPIVIYLIGG